MPFFGYLRIAQQISHAFGLDIDKDVVRRVLAKHYRPGGSDSSGPSWLTLIGQAKDSLWSIDLFRCESILLRSFGVLLVMDVFTRRIIGFGVERADIDGISVTVNRPMIGFHFEVFVKAGRGLWSLWAEGGAVDNSFTVIHGKLPGSPSGELSTNPRPRG